MHLAFFSWEMPYYSPSLVLEKEGIPLVKINIFQRFKYQKKRADSTFKIVF